MKRSIVMVAALVLWPAAAFGQSISPYASVEAFTDHRERGLSQTDGDAGLRAQAGLDFTSGLRADIAATTLSDSARHGGADAGFDLTASWRIDRGLFFFDAGATGHLYQGAVGNMDYVELFGGAGAMLGPAELGVSASYAPAQDAIGGDNFYLRARANVALVGTPVTLSGHVGRTSGDSNDPVRSARLRPGGSYSDWAIGANYAMGPVNLGLRYTDTDHKRAYSDSPFADARHSGAALTGRVSLSF